jgi:hypothetical protein
MAQFTRRVNCRRLSEVDALRRATRGGRPARQVVVDIHADVLLGLIDPGTPCVNHSHTEIHLDLCAPIPVEPPQRPVALGGGAMASSANAKADALRANVRG